MFLVSETCFHYQKKPSANQAIRLRCPENFLVRDCGRYSVSLRMTAQIKTTPDPLQKIAAGGPRSLTLAQYPRCRKDTENERTKPAGEEIRSRFCYDQATAGERRTDMRLIWRQNERIEDIVFAFKPGAELYGSTKLLKPVPKKMKDICNRLLSIGGDVVVCYIDKESPSWQCHTLVWKSGGLITPKKVRMKRGEPNSCFDNSMELWQSNPEKYALAIGWGLSQECWRPHAWCVDVAGNVIETTVRQEKYYGVAG